MDSDNGVPQLSLADYIGAGSSVREMFSGELMRGFQRYGFVILRDHPVPPSLLDTAYDLSAAFFAQSEEIKRRYVGGARGYAPFGTEHAKNRPERDLNEFWQIGPESANGHHGRCAPRITTAGDRPHGVAQLSKNSSAYIGAGAQP